jgi:hypothetical protein
MSKHGSRANGKFALRRMRNVRETAALPPSFAVRWAILRNVALQSSQTSYKLVFRSGPTKVQVRLFAFSQGENFPQMRFDSKVTHL